MTLRGIERIKEIRDQIDSYDNLLVILLKLRFECSDEIQKIKTELGHSPIDPKRFNSILDRLKEKAKENKLNPKIIEEVMQCIHTYSSKGRTP